MHTFIYLYTLTCFLIVLTIYNISYSIFEMMDIISFSLFAPSPHFICLNKYYTIFNEIDNSQLRTSVNKQFSVSQTLKANQEIVCCRLRKSFEYVCQKYNHELTNCLTVRSYVIMLIYFFTSVALIVFVVGGGGGSQKDI